MGQEVRRITYSRETISGERFACFGQTGAEFGLDLKSRFSPAAGALLKLLGATPNLNDPATLELALAASTELAALADAVKVSILGHRFTENSLRAQFGFADHDRGIFELKGLGSVPGLSIVGDTLLVAH